MEGLENNEAKPGPSLISVCRSMYGLCARLRLGPPGP